MGQESKTGERGSQKEKKGEEKGKGEKKSASNGEITNLACHRKERIKITYLAYIIFSYQT